MNTFICYNKDNFKILGFIKNDYTKIDELTEVFSSFNNYKIAVLEEGEVPRNFENYKVIVENEKVIGFEAEQEAD